MSKNENPVQGPFEAGLLRVPGPQLQWGSNKLYLKVF